MSTGAADTHTDHPTGAAQAVENAETEPPGLTSQPCAPAAVVGLDSIDSAVLEHRATALQDSVTALDQASV